MPLEEKTSDISSPFVFDTTARRVFSVDPNVKILSEQYHGGADDYAAYSVAISRGNYSYCFYAIHDYLRDEAGKYLLTSDRRPVGFELTRLKTRWQLIDRDTGSVFSSTFPDDDASYAEAVALAISFYSAASRRIRSDAPLTRIEFDPSEKVSPKVVEISDAL